MNEGLDLNDYAFVFGKNGGAVKIKNNTNMSDNNLELKDIIKELEVLDNNTPLTVGLIKEIVKKINLRIHNENVEDSYDRIQNYKKRK